MTTRVARRAPLLQAMGSLAQRGVGCGSCTGTCCTFVANSMLVTPLEALDLAEYLLTTGRAGEELTVRLEESVARFALDRPMAGDGKRSFSRRRYTCPFFGDKKLGCSIAAESKPYGCLAFNARSAGVRDGEDCASDQEGLAGQESENEAAENAAVKERLKITWEKESIPTALLDVLAKLSG